MKNVVLNGKEALFCTFNLNKANLELEYTKVRSGKELMQSFQ